MLSDYLTHGLHHLRQPRLLRPLCANMLGVDGLPQPSLLDGVDALICEDVVSQIMEWEMPAGLAVGTSRDERWRTVSSLQKAIRRGDVEAAMTAAHAAYGMDAGYLMRRLVVCAVEDVGLGNLYGVAATLALAGHRPSRKLAGEQKAAVWLAALLASGWKDRSACNLCVVVDFYRALHPTMDEWKFLSDSDLTTLATDLVQPVERRMLAAWLLAGTKRYWNVNVPTDNARPRWSLMKVMADSGMPLIFYWLADRAATRGGGCMFVSFLPLWQIFQGATREIELRSNSLPNQERIGPLLSAAYDMHTREGRAALQMLARTPGVGSVLAPAPPEARLSALFAAVFAVEGGLLNLRLSLPEFDRVHFEATTVELAYYGLTASSQAQALVHAAGSHLQRLHHLRLSVLQAVDRTAQVSGPTAAPLAGATNLPAQAALPLLGAPQRYKMGSPITLPEKDLASLLGSGGAWRTDEGFL